MRAQLLLVAFSLLACLVAPSNPAFSAGLLGCTANPAGHEGFETRSATADELIALAFSSCVHPCRPRLDAIFSKRDMCCLRAARSASFGRSGRYPAREVGHMFGCSKMLPRRAGCFGVGTLVLQMSGNGAGEIDTNATTRSRSRGEFVTQTGLRVKKVKTKDQRINIKPTGDGQWPDSASSGGAFGGEWAIKGFQMIDFAGIASPAKRGGGGSEGASKAIDRTKDSEDFIIGTLKEKGASRAKGQRTDSKEAGDSDGLHVASAGGALGGEWAIKGFQMIDFAGIASPAMRAGEGSKKDEARKGAPRVATPVPRRVHLPANLARMSSLYQLLEALGGGTGASQFGEDFVGDGQGVRTGAAPSRKREGRSEPVQGRRRRSSGRFAHAARMTAMRARLGSNAKGGAGEGGEVYEFVTASDAAVAMNQLKRLRAVKRGQGASRAQVAEGGGRFAGSSESDELMSVLEEVVTNGMGQLDAKYMALSLDAAVERRSPSRGLVSEATQRILAMRDDPVRDYVFTSKTMAQLLAAFARCPSSWLDPEVLETLCNVIIYGGGGSKDGWGGDRAAGVAAAPATGDGRPRPWRLGSSGAPRSVSSPASPLPPPPVRVESNRGVGVFVDAQQTDWGAQEISIAMSALATLVSNSAANSSRSAPAAVSGSVHDQDDATAKLVRGLVLQALDRLAYMATSLRLSSLQPQAISSMANALARADLRHEPLLHNLGRAVVNMPPASWPMQSVCSLVNALVRCQYMEEDVMSAIDEAVCSIAPHNFSPQGVALVANAMSKAEEKTRKVDDSRRRRSVSVFKGSARMWDTLATATLMLPVSAWVPQSLALSINAFASKLCALSGAPSSPLSSQMYMRLANGRNDKSAERVGRGGEEEEEEERAWEGLLARSIAQALWRLAEMAPTRTARAWKVQEVAMVVNGLARVEMEIPVDLLQHMTAVILTAEAQLFGARNAASILNALARMPEVRACLSEHSYEAMMSKLRDAALAAPPASWSAQSLANMANALVRLRRKDTVLLAHLCEAAIRLPPETYTAQDVGMIMNSLAHHATRNLTVARHLLDAYGKEAAEAGREAGRGDEGAWRWQHSEEGRFLEPKDRRADGLSAREEGRWLEPKDKDRLDIQAVCNILHSLASLNIRCRKWQQVLYATLLARLPVTDACREEDEDWQVHDMTVGPEGAKPNGQLIPQGVANVAWSVAVLDCANMQMVEWVTRALQSKDHGVCKMDLVMLRQVHQFLLWKHLVFLKHGFEADKAHGAASSQLQAQVQTCVERLGVQAVTEMIETETGYSVDLAAEELRILIEVDGPFHFAFNSVYPLGATRLKRKLLRLATRAQGWRCVCIPYWEWDGCEQQQGRLGGEWQGGGTSRWLAAAIAQEGGGDDAQEEGAGAKHRGERVREKMDGCEAEIGSGKGTAESVSEAWAGKGNGQRLRGVSKHQMCYMRRILRLP